MQRFLVAGRLARRSVAAYLRDDLLSPAFCTQQGCPLKQGFVQYTKEARGTVSESQNPTGDAAPARNGAKNPDSAVPMAPYHNENAAKGMLDVEEQERSEDDNASEVEETSDYSDSEDAEGSTDLVSSESGLSEYESSRAESGSETEAATGTQTETSESETDEFISGSESEVVESEPEQEEEEEGDQTLEVQATSSYPNELLLIGESSSESEPEGPPPSSYLHKLTIRQAAKVLRKVKAIDVKILNVQACCTWTDYMIFATGKSTRHIGGIADSIVRAVKKRSTMDYHMLLPSVEGRECNDWMVVDCVHIVVHVFSEEARIRYNLEQKWGGHEVPEEEYAESEDEEDEEPKSTDPTKKKKRTKKQKRRAALAAVARAQSDSARAQAQAAPEEPEEAPTPV